MFARFRLMGRIRFGSENAPPSTRDDAIRARLADVDRQEEKRRRLQAFLEKGDSRMESRRPPRNRGGGRGRCMGKEATQRGRAGF